MTPSLKCIIEGMLFVAEAPLSLEQLAQALEPTSREDIQTAIDQLRAEYQAMGRAFDLAQVAGGHIFRTRPELAPWLGRLRRTQASRLSRAALETLAIVAYKQPVMKVEIERIRGVEVGGVLRMLMERNLVRVAGRRDLPGRPLVYATTKRFLEFFDLKDLSELPTLEEIDKLSAEPDQAVEAAQRSLEFPNPTPTGEHDGSAEPRED
ncbi:chromosome segregation and condensation protein, ScpB [Desulfarculus baarsii DSM 2075]|uniref:Chromosome segregation and condensation protein, ScpB n=1 Tax=Desulfarculus baarsii (strain ATCC 33931 / DSM 2075 / LMG 7858 / VKM B-1802 / 2st14) TaxID=644282 RepID=E1QFW4_DESB2|nr:SMC-Scp complex subunit ScpB [Desulfarculus baarsii]ADK84574.1 chromosome segregation and condensation protein, ScpB [Desulfarculus baarsii DSM 2075]